MSLSLHDSWVKRLEVAQLDPSWHAQVEARVLRFLLSRYAGSNQEAPLADFPFYEGDAPSGRAHSPLSERQLHKRLEHIAQIGRERPVETPDVFDLEWEKRADEEARRRHRYEKRHERGYW